MNALLSRLPQILLASAVALSAVAAAAPRDPATGQATGQRMHKPFTVTSQVTACTPTNVASDPEEGGQVARKVADATAVQPANVASDPEEGGQVTAARTAKPKPKPQVSDISVMKSSDQASAALAQNPPASDTCH